MAARQQGKPLRAVRPNEKAPAKKAPVTVDSAAKSGDRRALLVAMRDRIATTVAGEKCPPRDLAALTKRLQDIAADIDTIDARESDELAGRVRQLEAALAEVVPGHALLTTVDDDSDDFDSDAI